VELAQTFLAQKGKWIGAKLGIYSLHRNPQAAAGHADFDFFRFKET